MIINEITNQAFVDGQNLFLGTVHAPQPWKVDLCRFREYLYKRYKINKAFYFLGVYDEKLKALYRDIFEAGFKVVFRAHNSNSQSIKKGNVDTDIVFMMMRNFCEEKNSGKLYLVSGDGDYFKAVKHLLRKGKFGKMLFPARNKASSLYRQLSHNYFDYLDAPEIKSKIQQKRRLGLGS